MQYQTSPVSPTDVKFRSPSNSPSSKYGRALSISANISDASIFIVACYPRSFPTATDNSSKTAQCYFKDFRCNRYGRMMRNNPFNYRAVNSIGFSASVFGNGGGAIRGMTGGNFSILIEKVELF